MAVQNFNPSESGSINRKWNPAMVTFTPRDPRAFREIDAALHRIAEAAARAGTTDDADYSEVSAAILDAHRLIDEMT